MFVTINRNVMAFILYLLCVLPPVPVVVCF